MTGPMLVCSIFSFKNELDRRAALSFFSSKDIKKKMSLEQLALSFQFERYN
jgi:hypothetical protein